MSNTTNLWQPAVGSTWNYILLHPLNTSVLPNTPHYATWDIDLYDNPASTITTLHSSTPPSSVICYFSAGTYENWRSDASNFSSSDLGKALPDWPGERWVNISSPSVRSIMTTRLDLAASKGCDGVDPDNVDGYANDNGLGLTMQDSIDYMTFLADEAATRNLSIGLKNANDIVPDVVGRMQWSVNEECHHYDECSDFSAFIEQGKPVFNVEYPKGQKTNNNDAVTAQQLASSCNTTDAMGFSTIMKNIDLDLWTEGCNGTMLVVSNGTDGSNSSGSGNAGNRISAKLNLVCTIVVMFSLFSAGSVI